ncbi:hypothetical protein RYH80_20080 [Halobaculum sp. MBLA0147]|uniref:hypothetical protein n=1 Tax=Halobaculum sp. MBLA0147 TaxID=3079934 RepID=UPI003525ACC9
MSEGNGDAKRDRDPFAERYDRDDEGESETTGSSKSSKSVKSAESTETAESKETIRDRKNVNMYLPEDLVDDLQIRYAQMEAKWRAEHGESLAKNREYYPAVVRAALNDTTVAEELGLEEK